MYFAYVDESGNIGPMAGGGSRTYTLGCVLLEANDWPNVFDRFIGFRRDLKAHYGIPVRAELKANYLLHNGGALRSLSLSEKARRSIYLRHLKLIPSMNALAFGVVWDKDEAARKYPNRDPREAAWERLLQRIERFTTVSHRAPVLLIHDEGENAAVRKMARKARRAGTAGSIFGTGMLQLPARQLLDDPVPRRSHESYFIQLADLVAFAAFRRHFPPPPGKAAVVPTLAWDRIGGGVYWQATMQAKNSIPGIVYGP